MIPRRTARFAVDDRIRDGHELGTVVAVHDLVEEWGPGPSNVSVGFVYDVRFDRSGLVQPCAEMFANPADPAV